MKSHELKQWFEIIASLLALLLKLSIGKKQLTDFVFTKT